MIRKSAFKTIYLFFFLVVIMIIGYFLYSNIVGADPIVGETGDSRILDFAGNIGKKQIFVKFRAKGNSEIIVKKSLSSYCSQKLSGFEDSAKIGSLINTGNDLKLIEISGFVGVHSENRAYYLLGDDLCPKPIIFVKKDMIVYNIYSDQPSFKLQDFDGDGFVDLATEYRNYDKNPLIDGIREIYLYNPQKQSFGYNRSEFYQQEGTNSEIK